MPRGDKPTTTALALKDGWIYEDALPATITAEQYDWWFKESLVLDGVRMGPPLTTQSTTTEPTLEELAIEAARFLESMPDIIIGKTQREAQQLAFALRARVTAPIVAPVMDGISWSALLSVLERLKSKTRNPDAEWYHGWNAAIQCLINDINGRRRSVPASTVAPVEQSDLDALRCECGDPFSAHQKPPAGTPWDICSFPCSKCECQEFIAPASPVALRDEAECYWCKHPDHGEKICPAPYLARGEGGLVGSYPCGCSHSTVIAANTSPSTLAKAAAREIARRWVEHDLPEKARVQSLRLHQLRVLAEEVIERCIFAESEDQKSTPTG